MSYAERSLSITVGGAAPSWWTDPTFADRTWRKVACGSAGAAAYQRGNRLMDAWVAPSLTTGSAANDGQRPNVFAYSGACVSQPRRTMIIHGGGHASYRGNEPHALNLGAEVPAWEALCQPSRGCSLSSASLYSGKNGAAQYDGDFGMNGAPQSSHTYSRLVVANDKMWLLGLGGMQDASGGANHGTTKAFWFDLTERQWHTGAWAANAALGASYPTGFMENTASVHIPQDGAIWTSVQANGVNAPSLMKFDDTTGALLTAYTDAQTIGWWSHAAALITGTRNVLLRGRTYYAGDYHYNLYLWNAASPLTPITSTRLTVSGVSGDGGWYNWEWGGVWHAASGALLCGDGSGETFVKVAPDTPGNYSGSWTATTITPSNTSDSSRVIPSAFGSPAYTYNRWNIIDDMGNGQSAIVYHPDGPSGPTYVYKLPAAGL